MSSLSILLKKGRDGPATLACIRPDGSRTWSALHAAFPVHDITHHAVESVLGFREAFFGLVASGWDIADFAAPGASKWLPTEALWAENIVAGFDRERGQAARNSAADFNWGLATSLDGQGVPRFRDLTEDELTRIRELRNSLAGRWAALEPGETLEFTFDPNSSR